MSLTHSPVVDPDFFLFIIPRCTSSRDLSAPPVSVWSKAQGRCFSSDGTDMFVFEAELCIANAATLKVFYCNGLRKCLSLGISAWR